MKIIRWLICCLALLYAITAVFAVTRGQQLPYEWRDPLFRRNYYISMVWMLPLSVLLTSVVTVSDKRSSGKNTLILVVTLLIAGVAAKWLITHRSPLVGGWVDVSITWEKRDNREVRVAEQLYDVGALRYNRRREVKLSPFLGIFNKVEPVEINKIDKRDWVKVNRPGAVQYP